MNAPQGPGRKLVARDLYRLRRAIATAQRAHLRAQTAQQALRELLLDLEHHYGLLGRDMRLDVHTGDIRNGHTNPEPVEVGGVK